MGALLDGVIRQELQLRGIAEPQRGSQLPAQVSRSGFQPFHHFLFLGFIQGADINSGIAEVVCGIRNLRAFSGAGLKKSGSFTMG